MPPPPRPVVQSSPKMNPSVIQAAPTVYTTPPVKKIEVSARLISAASCSFSLITLASSAGGDPRTAGPDGRQGLELRGCSDWPQHAGDRARTARGQCPECPEMMGAVVLSVSGTYSHCPIDRAGAGAGRQEEDEAGEAEALYPDRGRHVLGGSESPGVGYR